MISLKYIIDLQYSKVVLLKFFLHNNNPFPDLCLSKHRSVIWFLTAECQRSVVWFLDTGSVIRSVIFSLTTTLSIIISVIWLLTVDRPANRQANGQTDWWTYWQTDRQTCVCHKSGLTCFGPEAWPIKYGLGPCNNVIVSTGPSCSSTATKSVDTYNKYCMIMWLDCVIHKMTCLCVFNDMSTPSTLCGCLGCLHMEGPFRPLSILAGGG